MSLALQARRGRHKEASDAMEHSYQNVGWGHFDVCFMCREESAYDRMGQRRLERQRRLTYRYMYERVEWRPGRTLVTECDAVYAVTSVVVNKATERVAREEVGKNDSCV